MSDEINNSEEWSDWQRWHDIAQCMFIAGVVPDFKKGTMMKLNKSLDQDPNVQRRKEGTAQSSPVWYRRRKISK